MRKRLTIFAAASLASLALLVPAGSANAAQATAHWCSNGTNGYVVEPGKICTWYPVATHFLTTNFQVISGGSGVFCAAILQSPWPNGNAQPLDDYGRPTGWTCGPNQVWQKGQGSLVARRVYGGFGAVYGQAAILNFSTARIRIDASSLQTNRVEYFY
jgi:hypothetical protein